MSQTQFVSIGNFLDHATELLDELNTTHAPFILIQNDAPVAVVQNVHEYQNMLQALSLLKLLVQGEKQLQEGQGRPQHEVFADLSHLLESKR